MVSKSVFRSKTVWGIVVSVAGVIVAEQEALTGLLEAMLGEGTAAAWVDWLVFVAGTVLTFWGRLKATKQLRVLPLFLLAAMLSVGVGMGGCANAGNEMRQSVVPPIVQQAWPTIHWLADRGLADMREDGELGDLAFQMGQENIELFDAFVRELREGD